MAKGHREAAPRVLDGREHDGTLAAEGRPLTTRHIAVYPRILTAANTWRRAISNTVSGAINHSLKSGLRGRDLVLRRPLPVRNTMKPDAR